jgi:uncharacterized protein YraI
LIRSAKWALLGSLAVGGVLLAEDAATNEVWVKSGQVDIREGKGAVYPVVASVKKGEKLTIVAREGKWVKVMVGEKEGYVLEDRLSEKKVNRDMLAGLGGSDAGSLDVTAAGKGLDENAVEYGRAHGYNEALLNELVEIRKSVTPEMWMAFTKEGRVGPDAGAGASRKMGEMSETLLKPNAPATNPSNPTTKPAGGTH